MLTLNSFKLKSIKKLIAEFIGTLWLALGGIAGAILAALVYKLISPEKEE